MAINSSITATTSLDPELKKVNADIATTQQNLAPFQSPTSYLDLLGKVASASFNSNADTIAFRATARKQLYGEQGVKPANFDMLSPEQQNAITSASRPGLLAAIQGSQETEAARGTSISNFLTTEGGRYKDQAAMLTDSLNALINRRSELEQAKQTAQSESRNFFLDLAKNFPDMLASLTAEEQNKLFQGTADDKLLSKVGQMAKQERDRKAYASSGSANKTPLQKLNIPAGYDVKLQVPTPGFAGGGVDFYGPTGKMTREQWTNETGVNWQDAAQALGSQNAQDYAGTTTEGRLTAGDRASAQSDAYNYLSAATDADSLNQMVQQLLSQPGNSDYFTEINAAANSIKSLKSF